MTFASNAPCTVIDLLTYLLAYNDDDDGDADADAAQGLSQVSSSNNATLTRALSAESLLSQTAVASPKFFRGQFQQLFLSEF